MSRWLIRLSPLPGLPLLFYGVMMMLSIPPAWWVKMSSHGFSLMSATTLGIIGSVGLVLSSLSWTYESDARKRFSMVSITCGYIAVFVAVGFQVFSFISPTPETAHSTFKGLWGVVFILFYLSWPLVAGVAAISKLRQEYA